MKRVWIMAVVIILPAFSVRLLHADPMGTASMNMDVNESTLGISGDLTFADSAYSVAGNMINMSYAHEIIFAATVDWFTATFKCTGTNQVCHYPNDSVCPAANPCRIRSGNFVGAFVSEYCSGCSSGCTNCDPGCPICMAVNPGSFICPPQGCASDAPISFVGDVATAAGTLLAGLPPDLSFTADGTALFQLSTASGGQVTDHYAGALAVNAFEALATPAGPAQTVTTTTVFFDSSLGHLVTVETSVTFSTVTTAGTTTVTAVSNAAGALPDGFLLDAGFCTGTQTACTRDLDCPEDSSCVGYHGAFFDISTTATHSGPITVCMAYPDNETSPAGGDGFVDDTPVPEGTLRMLHRPNPDGPFVDVTLPGYPDTKMNVLCGQVDSLSPFVVAVATDIPGGGGAKTDCITEWDAGILVSTNGKGIPKRKLVCHDGDPRCDLDPAVGSCGFGLSLCPNQTDPRLPLCTPTDISKLLLLSPRLDATDPVDQNNLAVLSLSLYSDLNNGFTASGTRFLEMTLSSLLTSPSCLPILVPISVPLNNGKPGKRVIKLRSTTSEGVNDTDKIVLRCEP